MQELQSRREIIKKMNVTPLIFKDEKSNKLTVYVIPCEGLFYVSNYCAIKSHNIGINSSRENRQGTREKAIKIN